MSIYKEVLLAKANGETYKAELWGEINSIKLISNDYSITKTGDYPFYILKDIRADLQTNNIFLLVHGSRKDVYPSGMTLPSFMAYIHSIERPTSTNDLVNILDECTDLSLISTIEAQEIYHETWLQSL
jgi:hypothetical protein